MKIFVSATCEEQDHAMTARLLANLQHPPKTHDVVRANHIFIIVGKLAQATHSVLEEEGSTLSPYIVEYVKLRTVTLICSNPLVPCTVQGML